MTTMPSQQRGMSLISWTAVIIVVVILGTAAFRMVPAYLEYNTIRTAITNLLQDSKTALMSEHEIRDALSKRFTINQVNVIDVNDLEVIKDGGQLIIGFDYEVKEPLFYNVSIVMAFEEEFDKDVRQ